MRTSILVTLIHTVTILFFTSCRSYHVSLTYTPPLKGTPATSDSSLLRVGRVNDSREIQGTQIGTIRNEFGIPIKSLHAKRPVAQIAHNAFTYALKLRNRSPGNKPKYTISADILELWCHQYATLSADCRVRINAYQTKTKQLVFSREYQANRSDQTLKVTYWSNVEDLAAVMSETLQSVVDSALDDPDFQQIVR